MNRSGGGVPEIVNAAPSIRLVEPAERTVRVGEPLTLTAVIGDDDIPAVRPRAPEPAAGTPQRARAADCLDSSTAAPAAGVAFDPWTAPMEDHTPGWTPPPVPADGRIVTTARFSEPGTYVLRGLARRRVPLRHGPRHGDRVTIASSRSKIMDEMMHAPLKGRRFSPRAAKAALFVLCGLVAAGAQQAALAAQDDDRVTVWDGVYTAGQGGARQGRLRQPLRRVPRLRPERLVGGAPAGPASASCRTGARTT